MEGVSRDPKLPITPSDRLEGSFEAADRRLGFARTARHLLSLPHQVNPELLPDIESALGISLEELAAFGAQAYQERQKRKTAEDNVASLEQRLLVDQRTGAFRQDATEAVIGEKAIKAVEYSVPFFCLFADVNSLKYANDHTVGGHETGDLYLAETVSAIHEFFNDQASVVRRNDAGDELVIVGHLQPNRRHVDTETAAEDDFREILLALKQFISYKVTTNPRLASEMNLVDMRQLGFNRPLGASIGGVYVLPGDMERVGKEIERGERGITAVIKRIIQVADQQMYLDKNGQRQADYRFDYNDLYPDQSKFKN